MMDEASREKIQTEPLGLADFFAFSHLYFSSEMMVVLGISALFELPASLVWNMMDLSGSNGILSSLGLLIIYLFIWMIGALVFPLFIIWAVWIMKQTVDTGEASHNEAWQMAWKRYMPLAWTLLRQGLIVLGGFFLFVIPGVIWMIDYSFAIYIASALPMEGKEALEYSKKLVRPCWVWMFMTFLAITVATVALSMVISPKNIILNTLTTTCFALITPYSLFPYGIWFLNRHYLYQRALTEPPPADPYETWK
jgi:hypothetical protein